MDSSTTTTADSSDSTVSSWVQAQLTNIYTSTDPTSTTLFQDGDTSPFADNVRITVNENQLSKEEFGEDVRKRKVAAAKVDVTYGDVTQQEEDVVSGSVTITRSMKFRIRAANAQQEAVGEFTAKVDANPRKIVELTLKLTDRAIPVNIRVPNAGAHGDEL